jgi:hypothetical protein
VNVEVVDTAAWLILPTLTLIEFIGFTVTTGKMVSLC